MIELTVRQTFDVPFLRTVDKEDGFWLFHYVPRLEKHDKMNRHQILTFTPAVPGTRFRIGARVRDPRIVIVADHVLQADDKYIYLYIYSLLLINCTPQASN